MRIYRSVRWLMTAAACITLTGCALGPGVQLKRQTGGSAALFNQFRAYDGDTGRELSFADLVHRCRSADVILFGEQHNDVVCNQLQAQLLHALLRDDRPLALAMEFFEADTQAALDAYLRGRIGEEPFREMTRQSRRYAVSHRPLIELCRAADAPVIAANAPRRLVTAYRKSGEDFTTYRAGLDPAEQRWLPIQNTVLFGPYRERFMEIMGGHGPAMPTPTTAPADQPTTTAPAEHPATMPVHPTMPPPSEHPSTRPAHPKMPPQATPTHPKPPPPSELTTPKPPPATMPAHPKSPPTTMPAATDEDDQDESTDAGMSLAMSPERLFLAQLLWDEAMSSAIADYRQRHPRERVMLMVGAFHVKRSGGTLQKLLTKRSGEQIVTISYAGTPNPERALDRDDIGAADILIYGVNPPPREERTMPTMPPPATQPAESPIDEEPEQPTTQPTTCPTSQPTSAPAHPHHHAPPTMPPPQ